MNIAKLTNFQNGIQKYPRLEKDDEGNVYLFTHEKDGWINAILVQNSDSPYLVGDVVLIDSNRFEYKLGKFEQYNGKVDISFQNKFKIIEN